MKPMDNWKDNLQMRSVKNLLSKTKSFLQNQNDQQVVAAPSRTSGFISLHIPIASYQTYVIYYEATEDLKPHMW